MVQRVGAVVVALVLVGMFIASWVAVQSIRAGNDFLRTGNFVMVSKTEPLKIVNVSCQGCTQRTIRNRFTSTAVALEARYQAEQAGTLYLRFAAGTARVEGKTLHPGCYEVALEATDRFAVSASHVEIAFPETAKSCSASETS